MGKHMSKTSTTAYFPPDLYRQLKDYAKKNHYKISAVVELAIERLLVEEGLKDDVGRPTP